jgi:hypothetical protein
MKRETDNGDPNRRGKQNRPVPKVRGQVRIKTSQPPAGKAATGGRCQRIELATRSGGTHPEPSLITAVKGIEEASPAQARRPEIKELSWDLPIYDESYLLKNFMARRTCEVFGGSHKGERIQPIPANKALLLAGTPSLNRPGELFTKISYLDPTNWPSFKSFIKLLLRG